MNGVQRLLFLAAVGFAAQLVDGSLGMAYGLTASSLLLAIGLAPAAASASVHMAEVLTTVISGLAHWRAGNVNRDVVLRLALPGAAGAFAGALFLPFLPSAVARLPVSAVLIVLGFYVLARHVRAVPSVLGAPVRVNGRGLALLGLLGGFCDAVAGGGWGPVVASALLARAYLDPRRA
ncbi:MAG: sulfite exporter TauE/SafE family protein, partial [Clostridia bacterium]|nr:sulfite exporter TauE/SafE family protein [Clostridia bacterium]